MLKKISWLFLCLAILFPASVYAQNDVRFALLEVDLWPEYDRQSMLVIYRITLAPEVSLPAPINLRIPSRVGVPNAVAAKQADGSLLNIPYDLQNSGDWGELVFQTTSHEIQLEYYDPALVKQGTKRTFEYRWPGDYAVDQFTMLVQQPLGARDMVIAPSFGDGKAASDGFVYFTSQIGAIPLGQSFLIKLEYHKDTDNLSLTDLPISPSGPISESPLVSTNLTDKLPWLLGLIGLLLLVGGGLWYWQSGRDQPQAHTAHRRVRRRSAQPEAVQSIDGNYIYCHQCGKRASQGDRFCRSCGTQLKIN